MTASIFSFRSAAVPRLVFSLGGLALLAALAAPGWADECNTVNGDFTSTLVPGPSPIGINTHGILTGDLEVTYDFVMMTLGPDPDDPFALVYTGMSVITFTNGTQLFSDDTGIMYPQPDGTASFITTVNIVDGTRKYKGGSGQLVASGVLSFITGDAVGTYTGEICKK